MHDARQLHLEIKLSPHEFPATPRTFIPILTGAKARIFLHQDQVAGERESLEQVTTVAATPGEVYDLIDALNGAAATGRVTHLERLLNALPEAVAQACRQALDQCPDPAELVLGNDRTPLKSLRRSHFYATAAYDASRHLIGALDVGLAMIVYNTNDAELGQPGMESVLLSDDVEVDPDAVGTWLPAPRGAKLLERHKPREADVERAFADPRWQTHVSRAYWLWIRDEEGSDEATAEFIFEHFDRRLDDSD